MKRTRAVIKPSLSSSFLDRKTPPPFNKDFSFHMLEADKIVLPSTMPLYVVSGGQQEIVKLEIVMEVGRWTETQTGLSYFTAHNLLKGTERRSSFQLATAIDRLGAHIEVEPGFDVTTVSLLCLSSKIHECLELLVEVLTTPTFPDKELEQLKSTYLQTLAVNNEKTSYVASKHFRKALFGEGHPYGREATEKDVEALAATQLKDFHSEWYKPCAAFAGGLIDEVALVDLRTKLNALGYRVSADTQNPSQSTYGRFVEEKQSSLQSSIRVGRKVVGRQHPDYPLLLLLNHVLGGFFGSRLMKNLREERGLTYGVHSSISALRRESYLVIGSDVTKASRDLAMNEVQNEIALLRKEPVSTEELDLARYHYLGGFASDLSTIFAHSEKNKIRVLFGLDPDYHIKLIDRIKQATPEQLMDVAQRHLLETGWVEVAVG